MSSVYITGMGAVSCAGFGAARLWRAVLADESNIERGLGRVPDTAEPGASRAAFLARAAFEEALAQAGWRPAPGDGLILATTTGQIDLWEQPLRDFFTKQTSRDALERALHHQPLGSLTETVQRELGLRGPAMLLTSACSASTQALAMAALWIRSGAVRRCLVGGVEVLSGLTIEGFKSLQLLSEATCAPFDSARSGINLSEGAAFFCVEGAGAREPLCELRGWGFSSDAFHVTSPHPEGRGCFEAMNAALKTAGIGPRDVSWVHCHGTGSAANDLSEGIAVYHLLGDTPASSTKAIHGHALAASGALEAVICLSALRDGVIPPTHNLKSPDPKIPASLIREAVRKPLDHILKNTLGFGGNNAALVFSRAGGPA
ncbi:MAG TPA: beta-ketoacyl-[acyl-carrier-protein] synthase family protein [Bdellovibrionales bacterium]|nr:beta-ketoacyl-[acyl-carrier-protein] synthase family protein [Bdellovibrionales bacterium]